MFTQCPECRVVLELQASNLRDAQAYVRCGQCGAIFNALDTLTDKPVSDTTNILRPDSELAPPLLEPSPSDRSGAAPSSAPEAPAASAGLGGANLDSANPTSADAYSELPGYDFDVEYQPGADEDDLGDTGASTLSSVTALDYEFEEPQEPVAPETTSREERSAPSHPNDESDDPWSDIESQLATLESGDTADEPRVADDGWQREAVAEIESLDIADFPEADQTDSSDSDPIGVVPIVSENHSVESYSVDLPVDAPDEADASVTGRAPPVKADGEDDHAGRRDPTPAIDRWLDEQRDLSTPDSAERDSVTDAALSAQRIERPAEPIEEQLQDDTAFEPENSERDSHSEFDPVTDPAFTIERVEQSAEPIEEQLQDDTAFEPENSQLDDHSEWDPATGPARTAERLTQFANPFEESSSGDTQTESGNGDEAVESPQVVSETGEAHREFAIDEAASKETETFIGIPEGTEHPTDSLLSVEHPPDEADDLANSQVKPQTPPQSAGHSDTESGPAVPHGEQTEITSDTSVDDPDFGFRVDDDSTGQADESWTEVADWLVEFTGGTPDHAQSESEPEANRGDTHADKTATTEASNLPVDAADMPQSDPGLDADSPALDDEGEQDNRVPVESAVDDAATDQPDAPDSEQDDIDDWVIEREVMNVMADIERVELADQSNNDGSYSLTDDIPAHEVEADRERAKGQGETAAAARPDAYSLSDDSHLFESEDEAELLISAAAIGLRKGGPGSRKTTVGWVAASAVLVIALVGQAIYALAPGAPESSTTRQWAQSMCDVFGCRLPLIKATHKIVMINRSVRPHPGVESTLLITAIFRNEANHAQPFPIIEITLSDLRGQRVGMRRFKPDEYLETPEDIESGMLPQTLVPVTFEVVEPATEAPDFVFDFY